MAQFDVHRNLGRRSAEIPYVVVVQSRRLDAYTRRLVVPLVRRDRLGALDRTLNPSFDLLGEALVLHPLEMVSVPTRELGPAIASLQSDAARVIAAIDAVLTQVWG